ncbi:hypothetical protein [Pseudaestuariivita sp.]|uniref:hypothetical protein n=1 Tax=Pseudaestuariivita sp. TaxID=2211669 RepID=UPI0040598ADC
MTQTPLPPPPGSPEAVAKGCTCPVLDNARGLGWKGGVKDPETGETLYVMQIDFPLHGRIAA